MSNVRSLIQKHDLTPKRSLGQNFLVDETYLDRIVKAAALTSADTVLEIGPGLGGLTRRLAQQAGRVVAVELDDRLIELLRAEFANEAHVSIVHADILKTSIASMMVLPVSIQTSSAEPVEAPLAELVEARLSLRQAQGTAQAQGMAQAQGAADRLQSPSTLIDVDVQTANGSVASPLDYQGEGKCDFKVVANLPYYITNAVLRHLLEAELRPTSAVVMVQKEVAQRICAAPGQLSLLAVSVQFYAEPTLVHHVPAGAFYPRPKVDSAVLHLDIFPKPLLEHVEPTKFFRIVKAGFGQKRKQLLNSLSSGLGQPKDAIAFALDEAGIDATRRAQTLSIVEWGMLYDALT